MDPTDPRDARIARAVFKHMKACGLTPGLHHVEIRHDEDCARPVGGPCTCDPDIVTGAQIQKKYGEVE